MTFRAFIFTHLVGIILRRLFLTDLALHLTFFCFLFVRDDLGFYFLCFLFARDALGFSSSGLWSDDESGLGSIGLPSKGQTPSLAF
jgi:hypothetical protein